MAPIPKSSEALMPTHWKSFPDSAWRALCDEAWTTSISFHWFSHLAVEEPGSGRYHSVSFCFPGWPGPSFSSIPWFIFMNAQLGQNSLELLRTSWDLDLRPLPCDSHA